jgi:hypothetical protein
MLNPKEDKWIAEKAPWLGRRLDRLEEIVDKQWVIGRLAHERNRELIAAKHAAEADIALFDREAAVFGAVDAAAPKEELVGLTPLEGRSTLPNSGNPVGLDTARRRDAEKRLAKAKAALETHQQESRVPVGSMPWAEAESAARKLAAELARADADVVPFEFTGRASRKRLLEATKAANAADAERSKVIHSYPLNEEAKAEARTAIRSAFPAKVALAGHDTEGRAMSPPTVSLLWRDGNSAPTPNDLADMLGWLAGQRIEDEVFAQIDARYAAFAKGGILSMTRGDRHRELSRLNRLIHEAELEEAANTLAIMEADGVMLYPPARMSAKAILGIL